MSNIQDDLLDTRTRQLAVQDEDLQRLLGGDWTKSIAPSTNRPPTRSASFGN